MDVRRSNTALDIKVADGGTIDEGKQSAPLVWDDSIVIGNGVTATIEGAGILTGLCTNHQAGIVACAEVDINCQESVDVCRSIAYLRGKPIEFLCRVDDVVAVSILSADGADAILAKLMVRLCGFAFCIAISKGCIGKFCAVATNRTVCINLCMRSEGNGEGVLAERLIPTDCALVAVQFEAKLAACYLFCSYLCALYLVDVVEVVAVVEVVGSCAAMRQGSAVAVDARAFLEVACCVAVVKCYTTAAV